MKALLTALALWYSDPGFTPFELHGEAGRICVLYGAAGEEDFIPAAQRTANRRGEAVVVTQNGRFVCVVNPVKKNRK